MYAVVSHEKFKFNFLCIMIHEQIWFCWQACIQESDLHQKGKGYFKNVC